MILAACAQQVDTNPDQTGVVTSDNGGSTNSAGSSAGGAATSGAGMASSEAGSATNPAGGNGATAGAAITGGQGGTGEAAGTGNAAGTNSTGGGGASNTGGGGASNTAGGGAGNTGGGGASNTAGGGASNTGGGGASNTAGGGASNTGGGGASSGGSSSIGSHVCDVTVDLNGYTPTKAGCGGYTTCKGQIHFKNNEPQALTMIELSFPEPAGTTCTADHAPTKWTITDNGATSHRCVFTASGAAWSVASMATFGFGYDTTQSGSATPSSITFKDPSCP